ncbi:MAG: DUF167 domain-containing protein [Planctomycetota bacterium]|jgi:uncharacterized protein (TIGR00251 family)
MKDIDRLSIRDTDAGALIKVKVVPGSSRERIVGVLGDALKIATSAAPEKGKANAAVAAVLANALGVQKRSVLCVAGHTSPRKEFQVANFSAELIRKKLQEAS